MATLTVTTYQPASSITGLALQSTSGDYTGAGSARFVSPGDQLTVARNAEDGVSFTLNGALGDWYYLNFAGPNDAALAVGTYENAQRYGDGTPGLDLSGDGRGCSHVPLGRFVVREIQYGSDGSVQRFAADFEQHCGINEAPSYGEVRFNSTIPFSYLVAPASLTSPNAGTVLTSPSQTFQWTDAGATLYQVWVGSSPGTYDYGYFPTNGTTSLATTVADIPIDGRTVYLRLWSLVLGTYYYKDYSFATATPGPAGLTSPVASSVLAGSIATFTWNDAGASLYQLWVGNAQGAYDIGYFPAAGTTSTSTTVSGLPTDGRTLYVRLYSLINGAYQFRDYTYTAAGSGSGGGGTPASIISPASGSTLSSSSATFTWNDAGASLYQLWVGSSPGSYSVGYFPASGTTATSITVTDLPTDGRVLYVRLYSSINGAYQYRDFTYTAVGSGSSPPAAPDAAAISSPANGSTVHGASVTFSWNDSGASLYQLHDVQLRAGDRLRVQIGRREGRAELVVARVRRAPGERGRKARSAADRPEAAGEGGGPLELGGAAPRRRDPGPAVGGHDHLGRPARRSRHPPPAGPVELEAGRVEGERGGEGLRGNLSDGAIGLDAVVGRQGAGRGEGEQRERGKAHGRPPGGGVGRGGPILGPPTGGETPVLFVQIPRKSWIIESFPGGVPEWLKGADCKSVGLAPTLVRIQPPPPAQFGCQSGHRESGERRSWYRRRV